MALTDLAGLISDDVTVVFPKTLDGVLQAAPHTVNVTLASLAITTPIDLTDIVSNTGTKILRSSCIAVFTTAGGGTPTNNSELNALAQQMASDWYKWQLAKVSMSLAGTAVWYPDGMIDAVELSWQPRPRTRIFRPPFNDYARGTMSLVSGAGGSAGNTAENLDVVNLVANYIDVGTVDVDVLNVTTFNGAAMKARKNSTGSTFGPRSRFNFIEGTGVTMTVTDDAGNDEVDITINASGSTPTNVAQWYKVTKSYTDFATGSTSNNIEVYSLPAKGTVHGAVVKHSTSFTGGAIASYVISVGYSSSPNEFTSNQNVFGATGDTNFTANTSAYQREPKPLDFGSTISIRAYATSTGANLDAATQGSVDIYLLIATLP